MKKGLRLFWFSTGSEDGLIATTRSTVDMLKMHGFNVVFRRAPELTRGSTGGII
ncbi:MAG TPA: hypothetical protein VK789_21245 [Bryobacteraceae bacterium]|jgi:hypothetical protein|nr:hypothetical protein [Bryobacteraceae bacterium]